MGLAEALSLVDEVAEFQTQVGLAQMGSDVVNLWDEAVELARSARWQSIAAQDLFRRVGREIDR